MIKIKRLTGITPDELDLLSKTVIPVIILRLFNKSLKLLNYKSIGVLMCGTRDYSPEEDPTDIFDPNVQVQKAIEKLKQIKNPITFLYRGFKLTCAFVFFMVMFSYINYRWYVFFLQDSNSRNDFLANEFYQTLEKSKTLFPLARYYFTRANKKKTVFQSLNDLNEKLRDVENTPAYYFLLKSDYALFIAFGKELFRIGAISNTTYFVEAFTGYRGNQVGWRFDKESLVFLLDYLDEFEKISKRDRSVNASICFYNAITNEPFKVNSLNKAASRKGISHFAGTATEKILLENANTDIPKILRVYKAIYS